MTPIQKWLADQWSEESARTLQSMTDVRPSVTYEIVEAGDAQALTADAFFTEVTFTAGAEAIMWLAFPSAAADALGGRTLTAAGIEDAGSEEIQNTYQEIVQQSHAGLAQAISRRLERGVNSKGKETDGFPTDQPVFKLSLSFPESPAVFTFFTFSTGLLAALELASPSVASKPEESGAVSYDLKAASLSSSKTFDVLLEVSMPVSVSFGRTEMLIKDVLKLTTGSIFELNRSVTEPVDVIVNDQVIARGEVVVVDGNYGVRIKQIISLQERFRTSTQTTMSTMGK